jgi:hypothetical protein
MTLKRTALKPGTKPLSRSTPIQRKPLKPAAKDDGTRVRYAWVVCLTCGNGKYMDPNQCPYCGGSGKIKAELIRVASGSGARGGARKTSRTSADAKHSDAVRERDGWCCTVCHKDFKDNPGGLDAMHFVKRRYRALRKGYATHNGNGCCLRHDLGNALAGCKSCHMKLEGTPENEIHFRNLFGNEHIDALLDQKPISEKIVPRRLPNST